MKLKVKTQPITHCIFDLDGTILDTENIYRKGYRRVCEKYGKREKLTQSLESRLAGQSAMQVASTMQKECAFDMTSQDLRKELDKEIAPILSSAKLKPGAEKLISHLADNGIPLAIASSSRRRNAKLKMSSHKSLFSSFNFMVFRDDEGVSAGKPSPEIFLKASEYFDDVDIENILVFEDSVSGVKAAQDAGMNVVMIPDTEAVVKSVDVISSLENFRPEAYGLPPYEVKDDGDDQDDGVDDQNDEDSHL